MKTAPLCTHSLYSHVLFLFSLSIGARGGWAALCGRCLQKQKWKRVHLLSVSTESTLCEMSPNCLNGWWGVTQALGGWMEHGVHEINTSGDTKWNDFLSESRKILYDPSNLDFIGKRGRRGGRVSDRVSKHLERPFRHYWDFWRGEEKTRYYFILISFLNIIIY